MTPPFNIAHYRVSAKLGAGGMGVVYRATDTRLEREVAIKVLPDALANDPDYLARFVREARVLASLNHPNIAIIHGVEEKALVMELVPGPTLQERIDERPLPIDEALAIARQIAAALEAAHEKGVIHRDLKPANVKVTPEGIVKVLDFGLAKAADPVSSAPAADSPTLTIRATQAGIIIGTAAYMAPEQAAGRAVDRRADIWSFGVVLYEMLTGKRLFTGETVSHTLASVLKDPIDFAIPEVSGPIRRLLARCLTRNPKDRLRDIGEARFLLERPEEYNAGPATVSQPIPPQHKVWNANLRWAAAALVILAVAGLGFFFRENAPVPEVTRFEIPAPQNVSIGSQIGHVLRLSPNGRRIAFVGTGPDGRAALWLRSLDSLEVRRLPGTEDATALIWSPDARFLAFGTSGKLKKIDLSGGPAQTLCEIPASFFGGSWNPGGDIIYAIGNSGLWRVSEAGGVASKLTELDSARQEPFHAPPVFLPDGRHFLYYRAAKPETVGIYVGDLEAKPEQQSSRRLLESRSNVDFAPSPEPGLGHLLFLRDDTLMAQSFDASRLELSPEAVPIVENVGANQVNGWFSVSTGGVLSYRTGSSAGKLTWFDRGGTALNTGFEGAFRTFHLSPDGTRVAAFIDDGEFNVGDLWILDLGKVMKTRFTFDKHRTPRYPVWSPDGNRIVFSSRSEATFDLFWKPSNGGRKEELLLKSSQAMFASDWSRDGKYLLYTAIDPKTKSDIWYLPMTESEPKPQRFLSTEFRESDSCFSPDARFVAYSSDESGHSEVYVRSFPDPSGRWQVSKNGGSQPRWRRDGKELFYVSSDGRMMAVNVMTQESFQTGGLKELFRAAPRYTYAVSPDGQRFLFPTDFNAAAGSPITVVLNWQTVLSKK